MMDKLLPCPFCGGTPILELFNDGFFDYARIRCCRIMFDWCGDETREQAIAAWNRRADHLPDATKMVSNADRIRGMSIGEAMNCPKCNSANIYTPAENLFICNRCGHEWQAEGKQ